MTERHIVAMGGGGFSSGSSTLDRYALSLVGADRPRVCFLPTASGDDPGYTLMFYRAYSAYGCDPFVLNLFQRDVDDVLDFILGMDMVYVGGGNTANMLAVWRLHGLDAALRDAWHAGVVMSGLSAGGNCWFDASTTDSYLIGNADPLLDGLGFIGGSFCPHYSSEPSRRPGYLGLVSTGALPVGYACEDGAAVHFAGTELRAAVSVDGDAASYRVIRLGDGVSEEALPLVTPAA